MMQLYQLFWDKDATQVEINPMAESADGEGIMLFKIFLFHTCSDFHSITSINFLTLYVHYSSSSLSDGRKDKF